MTPGPEPAPCLCFYIKFYWHTGPPLVPVSPRVLSHDNGRVEQFDQLCGLRGPGIYMSLTKGNVCRPLA